MKYFIIALICSTCIIGVQLDDSNNTDKKTNNEANTICTACKCKPKLLNCEGIQLYDMFAEDDWIKLDADTDIDTVNFDANALASIPEFPKLQIRILSLRHNLIDTIAKCAFKQLQLLEELDLSHNRLTYKSLLPEVFEGVFDSDTYEPLKSLRVLNLAHNHIHALDADLFEHLPNLESLSLETNPFMVIDVPTGIALSSITNLKFLDMSYMELSEIPDLLFHSPRQLETLNLTGNLLEKVPSALVSAVNLKYLSLDENPIKVLDENNSIPKLPSLEILSISYMDPLKSIGNGALSAMPKLTTLYCTNNSHLSHIHPDAFGHPGKEDPSREEWPPLKYVYLQHNNLSTLSSNVIARWDEVEIIDIRTNPWQCDCDIEWILNEVMDIVLEKTPDHSKDIVCDSPTDMMGIKLEYLKRKGSHMRCLDKYGNHPERDGTVLIGVLVGLLIGIPISLAIIFIYRRGCFGYFGYAGAADYSRAFYKRADLQDDMHI